MHIRKHIERDGKTYVVTFDSFNVVVLDDAGNHVASFTYFHAAESVLTSALSLYPKRD